MENISNQNLEQTNGHRIVDRLDIQLLITVIIFFVSAWAYLNGIICDFSGSEPVNVQMSYIYVHYVLTVILVLSIVLTAIKSSYILNNEEIKEPFLRLFKLFLDSWYWILGFCLLIILLSDFFNYEWLLGSLIICVFISFKMKDIGYSKKSIVAILFTFFIGFPVFLSTMTSIEKDIEVETDKPFYSFSDKVLITANARGYACRHKLVGLSEEYNGAKYYSEKGFTSVH